MHMRMQTIIQGINAAGIRAEHAQSDRSLWCMMSRSKGDRSSGNGMHGRKIRKLLHIAKIEIHSADCSYKTGTVWVMDHVAGHS